ncbi:MAG TPA: response regulator [Opitutaceae bacterium]|jgi:PAS domain S-box-containing protein|nr:response regulator [Opitutaceae bacterium]
MIRSSDILKASILIVDDQEANVTLLEQMLRSSGYVSVASTRNPREVCELHRQNRYDLILLDLQMPGMDGFEVMEGLKKIETGGYLPVLVVTAQPDHKLRALKAGAKDFVSKPFDLAEVLIRVYNMLEIRLLHQSEAALNSARLENSQRITGLGDWDYNFADDCLLWSEEVYRILGILRKDALPDSAIFYRQVHPDDLAFVHREKKAAAEGSRRIDFEHRIIRPDGEVRYIHQITQMILDDQGRPARESGTLQDVTERRLAGEALRQSEERFKFVARAVSDVVWDWDLKADTLWWNDGFLTTFGFAAGEISPSVESWTGRIHPDDRRRVLDSIHHAVDTGMEAWSEEYRFQRKDASHAFVQDRGYILRDATGHGIRMVGGMRDLTEQKKMEEQHLRALRMESIGTLAGGIAHDLNNVLSPIMMAIELLKSDSRDDPRREKILDTVHVSCRRGADLVRQVLTFARGLDGQRIAIHLRHLTDDLEAIISEIFPRNIRIVTDVSNDLWPVTGDPTQLHQVLLNLAINARDAMPHGGTLTVAATNVTIDAQYAGMSKDAKAGPYVLVQVTDTGLGISPETRARIFEPFFTTKEIGKGTGIGLATVHTIVKSHGGFLNVESEVGKGTSFKIYLPADPAYRPAEIVPLVVASLPRGGNELVLVVDDEFSIRDITQQTLEIFGYRVITASDGAEAIALYAKQAQQIALVLTDMMMPIMDGAATIQVLMRINPAVKIIVASGIDSGENVDKAASAGVHDFLPKPYTAETLLKLFREVLDRPAPPPPAEPTDLNGVSRLAEISPVAKTRSKPAKSSNGRR